jgi:hypothetical protein
VIKDNLVQDGVHRENGSGEETSTFERNAERVAQSRDVRVEMNGKQEAAE